MLDSMLCDGLNDAFSGQHSGWHTEDLVSFRGVSRHGHDASEHFQRLLAEQGIVISMSRPGEVWDNSAIESFFSRLKTERTARKGYRLRSKARSDVFH